VAPAGLAASLLAPGDFVLNIGNLVIGRNNLLQSTTNLASGVWTNETNFLATQSVAAFTNSAANNAEKFYRIVAY